MNKTELISTVAEKTMTSKKDAEKIVNGVFLEIADRLSENEKVQIMGFGTFEVRNKPERDCKNPRTGEKIRVASTDYPVFKAGQTLKDVIAK